MSRLSSAAAPPCFAGGNSNRSLLQPKGRWLQFPARRGGSSSARFDYSEVVHHHHHHHHHHRHHNRRMIKAEAISGSKCHTYSFKTTTDIPFYEAPQASFDQYLEEKSRVLKALCSYHQKRKPEQINEEEWRIYMAPIEFMFLSATPVVHMRVRCKTKGQNYPSNIPPNTSKLLELKVVKSELRGDMEALMKQTEFRLGVEGVVYPERKGIRSRIKGHLTMSVTFIPPPALSLLPPHLHTDAAQLILRTVGERMERNVSDGLLADYGKFKQEIIRLN